MDKRDPVTHGPDPRSLIDQRDAFGLHLRERRLDVLDLDRDVVQARALLGQEAAHRRIRAQGFSDLQVRAAGVEHHHLDALVGNDRFLHHPHAEHRGETPG